MYVSYDTSLNNKPPFQCLEKFKTAKDANKYYSFVCDGANGAQELLYPKPNCKGTPTVAKSLSFSSSNCKDANEGMYMATTCRGPSKLK